ncbi:MAG TPA: ABC transporter permease [Candidatus Solibacter sp.]|nr:ABC transporter permease [Candidatus Solibacter sp.]
MHTSLMDLRFAFRTLGRNPAFTAAVVVTLALGIGVNTAIFSAVNGMILRPLPYADAGRLVFLSEDSADRPGMSISPPDLKDWQEQNHVFSNLAGYRSLRCSVTGRGPAQFVRGAEVNANLFGTLGVQPIMGRTIRPEEDRAGGARAAVIGENLWRQTFGGTPDIVSQGIVLDGEEFTIVGVMPATFHFPAPDSELWVPLEPDLDFTARGNHPGVSAVARLKPGVELAQARVEMSGIARKLEQQYPNSNSGTGALVKPLAERIVGESLRRSLWLLWGAVGFVLLIVCVNVANLLLARSGEREREFATRRSLGATRIRVVQQLLAESVLLSFLGGGLGILLAYWGLDALKAMIPAGTPRLAEIQIDPVVLLFTAGVCLLTGVAVGVAPALHMAKPDLADAMRQSGRSSTGNPRNRRPRSLLVLADIALSLMLLIGAGLLLRSFENVRRASPGLDPSNVMTLQITLSGGKYNSQAAYQNFLGALLERVRAMPGVESAAAISPLPVSGENQFTSITIEGHPPLPPGQYLHADFAIPSVDYFQTMRIPLLRGRLFEPRDLLNSPPVALIDDLLAREYFPGEDPIGKRISYGAVFAEDRARTIVGVVQHVKTYGVDAESSPVIFDLTSELPFAAVTLLVRSQGNPAPLVQAVRKAVTALDPGMPVFNVRPMSQVISGLAAPRRLSSTLLTIFAALALLVAVVGIYGVTSHTVARRTQEIGIRMALGAQPGGMAGMIVGEGLRVAAAGVLAGWAGAKVLEQLITSQLFEVSATDPLTFLGTAALLVGITGLACYLPARRAARVNPIEALRHE